MQLRDLISWRNASNGLKTEAEGIKRSRDGKGDFKHVLSIRRDDRDGTVAIRQFGIWFDDCEEIMYVRISIHLDFIPPFISKVKIKVDFVFYIK